MLIGINIGIVSSGQGQPKTAGVLRPQIGFPLLSMPNMRPNFSLLLRDAVSDAGGFESGASDAIRFPPAQPCSLTLLLRHNNFGL